MQSSVAALAAKGTQILVSIISVPILLGYLGKEGYGLVLAVTSVLNWIMLSDMGVANGVKNHLIGAFTANDKNDIRKLISTGIYGLALFSMLLAIIFVCVWYIVPWHTIFNAPR